MGLAATGRGSCSHAVAPSHRNRTGVPECCCSRGGRSACAGPHQQGDQVGWAEAGHQARADLQPEQTFVVIPGDGGYPLADGVPDLATPGIQRPRPGRPKPAPGCTPAPEAGPPKPPAAGATGAGRTSPGPAWPKPAPGRTPAPEAGPPKPPAAGATGAGRTSPGPAWPKPAPGRTPAPEPGPPTPPRIGWPWAGSIPPMPAPLRAMATNRGAEIREGNERCMAGAEGDSPIVGAESRLGISG